MSKSKLTPRADYASLLGEIKSRIQASQVRAVFSVNAELVRLYWDIGRILENKQQAEGWGAGVIPRLASDLKNELPQVKGFSERNIDRMIRLFRAYPDPATLSPQPVAKLPTDKVPSRSKSVVPQAVAKLEQQPPTHSLLWMIPWSHHVILLEKVKDYSHRLWYMEQALHHGWSRNILSLMIDNQAHTRQGKAITNFPERLPPVQSDLVVQTLKDPYIFDFLTLTEPFQERELETGLLQHLEKFLLELGKGFAFVGRQYHIDVGDGDDFYIDLLFYHLHLRCFVVIDLKTGAFKPEYAGKMNFYLSVVDEKLRHAHDAPSIGLILCQDRNRVVAEYALRGINKPIGISEYEVTRALPKELASSLPTIEAIEAELAETPKVESKPERKPRKKGGKR
jgi:predicted nuclease of restriction endonuclease-like (RecB) superfamily